MGINIPGELADLLNELGFTWPKSDETALIDLGGAWVDFANAVDRATADAQTMIADLPGSNVGSDLESFLSTWDGDGSATAPATAGVSLAAIPVFKRLTNIAIDFLINEALGVVLG